MRPLDGAATAGSGGAWWRRRPRLRRCFLSRDREGAVALFLSRDREGAVALGVVGQTARSGSSIRQPSVRSITLFNLLLASLLFSTAALSAAPPPVRIVSTAPSITEMLYALGLGPNVVGDTIYCTYPDDARTKPKIGTFLDPDLERILALRPDLVLVIKNPIGVTQKLRSLGLARRRARSGLGRRHSLLAPAHRPVDRPRRRRRPPHRHACARSSTPSAASPPRFRAAACCSWWDAPPARSRVWSARVPGTFIDELLHIAGASNVLASSPMQYPNVSLEQILTRDPEVILDMGDFAHAEGRPGQPPEQILALWAAYPRLRAVSGHHVQVIASDVFVRPGPRMAEAARAALRLDSSRGARRRSRPQ